MNCKRRHSATPARHVVRGAVDVFDLPSHVAGTKEERDDAGHRLHIVGMDIVARPRIGAAVRVERHIEVQGLVDIVLLHVRRDHGKW